LADEVTLGEVHRGLREHEQRSADQHRALDERITSLAAQSVSAAVYQADQRATVEMARRLERDHGEDVRKLREDVINPALVRIETLEKRPVPTMTFGKWIALAGAITGFLTVIVAAWAVTKGAA
jgi:hypothetical protein